MFQANFKEIFYQYALMKDLLQWRRENLVDGMERQDRNQKEKKNQNQKEVPSWKVLCKWVVAISKKKN